MISIPGFLHFKSGIPYDRILRRAFLCLILIVCCSLLPLTSFAYENSVEKDIQNNLEQSKAVVITVLQKLKADATVKTEISQLKAIADNIRISNMLLEERFKLREEKAKTLGATALNRHQVMVKGYRKALADYLGLVDGLPSERAISQSSIQNLQSLLGKILTKKKHPIIGSLPYKHLNYPAQVPSSSPSITPAYKGGNKTVSPDDTSATDEAPLSNEIATLAQSLNWNPVSIYEYVKNNIETEWYWGCMKGAEDTLHQKSGNDCDQAALFTALLRASGFPTRYVRGVIQFFPDISRAQNLTGVDDPAKIAEFFQKAGIPYTPVIAGGKISNFQIEHIWVESQIPYSNYRGVVIDTNGKTWLGLDTSIKVKGYTYNNTPDILSVMSFSTSRDEYLGFSSSMTGTSPFVQNQMPLEYLQASINAQFVNSQATTTYSDYLRTRTFVPEVLNILPASLQFTQVKVTNEYPAIPDELIHKVKFTATNPQTTNQLFTITLPVYKLSNQQTVISYEPDTIEDQKIVDSYFGLDNTPAYLVSLRPVLKINGERIIVAQDGLPMGSDYALTLDVISANGTEQVSNNLLAGNLVVIGMTAQKAFVNQQLDSNAQKDAERLLYEEAMHYADRWRSAEEELAALLQMPTARPIPSIVMTGGVIDVTYLLDIPHGFTWNGVYVDAKLRAIESVHRTLETGDRPRLFMQLSSLQGSVLENRIFEDDFQVQSISTAKLLQVNSQQYANDTQLLTIDNTNIAALLPILPFDQSILDDITDAVNQNFIIRIPQTEMVYQDWRGIGYLKEKAETGESGWMLSGSIAGGMTALSLDKWPEIYLDTLQNPFAAENTYAGPSTYDPVSGNYLKKVAATDLQTGLVGAPLPKRLQVKVTDSKQKPMPGVTITFTIKAGGGTLDNVTATTNALGIASTKLTLGKYTKANSAFQQISGDMNFTQVGENIVDAALPSGANLSTPFTAIAVPGQPRHMRKTFGDGMWSAVLSFAGFVSVEVEDEYDNPISNIPVLFQVKDSVQNPNTPNCPIPTTDTRNAYLIESAAPCLKQAPTWGICGITSNQAMTIMTDNTGASAEVILGGREDAIYAISAVVASNPLLNTEFKMYTYDSYFMNNRPCTGTDDPYYELFAIYTYTSDQYGNNINAGKTNSTIPVQANYYYLAEEETNVDVTLNCGSGPLTCNKVVGNRTYNIKKDFKSSNVTFSGVQGVEQGQGTGVFKANYKLKPGLNTVTINGTATIGINKTTMGCPGTCNTAPQDLAKTTMTTMEVYGVEVKTQPIPMMLVNETGYLFSSQTITYTIEPLDSPYKAMTAYVFIYKDGNIVAQIPSETKGTGTATLSKGFQFDVHSKYEAEVVLNYGTGVEIRSEKKEPLLVAQLKVLTDEAAPATVDEIKFSKGNKSEKRYAIQLTAAGTPSSCASFRGSAIVVDSNGNAINPPAGDSITMYGKASYDLYFMTMGNICTGVLEETGTGVPWTKFALTNRAMQNSDVQIFTGNQATALYGGLGNKFRITLNGTTKDIPIEPVGVIILGIDGLRQDVLYPTQVNSTSTVTASYSDPNGCGDNVSCYVAPTHLTGLCEVLGGTFSNTCDTTTMKDKHIKLPGVTAIFPSITFASWASIFTGKMPNETGILGNEFFARDLYDPSNPTSNTAIPGMSPLPSGMVTLDADGGAFRAANATILPSMRFALNYVMPAEYIGFGYDTLTKKLNQSAPGATLSKSKTATPFWNDINTLVSAKYHTSNDPDTKCVGTEYECRTVTMFNQYAQGADWWGTPSFVTRSLWDATKSWYDASVTMDESSAHEATEFIEDYFKNTSINGKKKRFPAVFSVYLPGLDHDAHMKGMTDYTYFFTHTTDVQIQNIVTKLKDQDEFDNKIFIVTADHGHTAMPIFGDVTLPDGRTVKPDMSCELNVTDFDEADVQGAEQANNNLHIWELGEVFTAMGGLEGASIRTKYKILVPDEIEEASVTNGVPEEFSPTSDIGEADIVVALNGPMAHIYSMVGTDNATLGEIAEAFRVMLGGFYPDEASKYGFSDQYGYLKFQANNMRRLWNSIDKILIRLEDGDYYVFNGLDESGNPVAGDLSSLSELDYADGVKRIKGMNNKNRSGDIVLLMKDDVYYPETENIADHRFTSGVACKSWHGSLNRSDSYVPFFVTYPGGNKNEIEQILQKDILCKQDYSECKANWKLSDIVKEIISEQYK